MTYMSGLIVRAADENRLLSDMNALGRKAFEDAGAKNMWITKSVMAGEAAGEITLSTDWDSIDAAVTAPDDLRARPDIVETMQAAGVQTLRRSLLQVRADRGELDGEFGSMLVSSGAQVDQETIDATVDAIWAHLRSGANGVRLAQAIAAGPLTGLNITISTSDSLDALMAASAQMFAEPSIQSMMAEQHFQLIQRSLFRNIG